MDINEKIEDFNFEPFENHLTYQVSISLKSRIMGQSNSKLEREIKEIRIYKFQMETKIYSADYISMIEFETKRGRSIVIREIDKMNKFTIGFDELISLKAELRSICDEKGSTYGKNLYYKKYEFS